MSTHADRLIRLQDSQRILSRQECDAIFKRASGFAKGGGDTTVEISSWWQGELRWARNRVSLASDRRENTVTVHRAVQRGVTGRAQTNQFDDFSLEAAVRAAERVSRLDAQGGKGLGFTPPAPKYERPQSAIWSDATYDLTTESRGEIVRALVGPAEAKAMLSAGYIEVRAGTAAELSTVPNRVTTNEAAYVAWTQAHCSTTVRDSKGTGSGWAGLSSYDWAKINGPKLAERALEKCLASQNPVALEPGRYTVVLEPQAVADLMSVMDGSFSWRENPETGMRGPWLLTRDEALGMWRSKLGLKVVDERITISHDFNDPELGIVAGQTQWPQPVKWIDRGVLTNIGHQIGTDIRSLEGRFALRGATGYRMSGGSTTVEEMIATTKRGLLVTRFSNIRELDGSSLLSTGLTRDGLWLIENGKISKAVKNFRFTESPLFMLNSIEQLGVPVPVFRPTKREGGQLTPAIVPPLKVRDFSFTSMIDAV